MVEVGPQGLEHLKLEPLSPSIGTVIHGVDLANLTEPELRFLRKVWLERKVIFFRKQGHLTHQQHLDFARHFGDVQGTCGEWDREPSKANTGKLGPEGLPTCAGFNQVLVLEHESRGLFQSPGGWHIDATWTPRPPMGSILLGRKLPPVGGGTMFCDTYAAYEGLSTETKEIGVGVHAQTCGKHSHLIRVQQYCEERPT